MKSTSTSGTMSIDLEKVSQLVNRILCVAFLLIAAALFWHPTWYIVSLFLLLGVLNLANFYFMFVQKKHALLRNFGLMAQLRYIFESLGPEFRQYFFLNDTEERPFNRNQRSEVYQMSKGVDSSGSFGTLRDYHLDRMKLRHTLFPKDKKDIEIKKVTFGEERGISSLHTLNHPVVVSAMSYGSLSKNAIMALSLGAKKANLTLNTGEGGYPKYHLYGGSDLIFQMGTAKFGCRTEDGYLEDQKLEAISQLPEVKMIEVKFSQGAKPGKGGLLPKEKITDEIAELRGVPKGKDVVSPAYHYECTDEKSTVDFIRRVQEVSQLPVGMKLCLGRPKEFYSLMKQMKEQKVFPDFISFDGGEGGTGAAPRAFLDHVGMGLFESLKAANEIFEDLNVRDSFKVMGAGRLINAGRQFYALSSGCDAVYTARGFMLAMGCIQALQCNRNSCPVGLTSHRPELVRGLNIEDKAIRIENYAKALKADYYELLAALGETSVSDLSETHMLSL